AGPVGATGATGAAGPAGVGLNPLQVATLHWWQANTGFADFTSAGEFPRGVAFDGSSIWVSRSGGASKFRPYDGAYIVSAVTGGSNSGVIAFDGLHIWVAVPNSSGNGTLAKIRAFDGVVEFSSASTNGGDPSALVYDGNNLWVTNRGSGNLVKIRISDGA